MERPQRLEILKQIRRIIEIGQDQIMAAMVQDMKKPLLESYSSEIMPTLSEIDFALRNLKRWMRPKKVATPKAFFPAKSYIYNEPKGRVLIIGAWNYPFQLCLIPAVGAIAAGNNVVVKPSELAPHTSSLIKKLFGHLFEVVEGGVPETTELLSQKFDHIFYTGGAAVGKIVMQRAAEFLTPVTLELGGKSPAIVLSNPKQSAKRIAWGKFYNCGQTCVAPDYILIDKKIRPEFELEFKKTVEEFYGRSPIGNSDLASIINQKHYQRLKEIISQSEVILGGECDDETFRIAPTLVEGGHANMEEEIFGPILPIVEIDSVENVITFVRARPNPLALYLFCGDKKIQAKVLNETSAGGVCINDTLIHLSNSHLPFGGIGQSGMGNYHGRYSFDTFSHPKAVMKRSLFLDIPMRYPPYKGQIKLMKLLQRFGLL